MGAMSDEWAAEGEERLPTIVRRFVERNLPEGPLPTFTRVSQRGRMWKAAGSKPMLFTGVAEYQVRRVAFSWRAKFPLAGPLAWLSIVDAHDETGGRMDGRVWGLVPFMPSRGDEVQVGEVSRYVAELPWSPYGIVGNRDLEWREAGGRSIRVATSVGPRPIGLTFGFDGEGHRLMLHGQPPTAGWQGERADAVAGRVP
jgi:Family of unknown function (DUF6544)